MALEEVWALFRETDRKLKELAEEAKESQRETDRQLRELGKQIGGLGNKFGSFTERLALPSMEKILRRRFGVDTIAPSVRVSRGGQPLELDVLAYANGEVNTAYMVEVKSHLREEHIQQLLEILEQFAVWFPEHRDKRLYGILAAVHIPQALRPRVLEQGLYLAHIHDDLFELEVPDDFQPRRFDHPAIQPV
ncbi:MAG: DUF3782 domain-containing protein [Candidatus Contendobacter sp.]|nr:DUF3782 domain-containing protein [Candidatus Contendobacter sp.]MDG4556940.1 DUF3782 domain-containing protein [Candidatus Contendobacter sp.]